MQLFINEGQPVLKNIQNFPLQLLSYVCERSIYESQNYSISLQIPHIHRNTALSSFRVWKTKLVRIHGDLTFPSFQMSDYMLPKK